ncbi:MAG: MoaD/ThiS family protein [Candidatus Rokubacteria bacterium]|nr:MoaD/ThiS family protein [Candidatus Rokubacteria bacterium]
MVGARTGTVRLEIVPWLTQQFGKGDASRLLLEEDVEGAVTLGDFLASLAEKYPAFGTAILDIGTGRLAEHVSIVHNGTVLGGSRAADELVRAGDSLIFLPAFSGG